MKNRSTMNTHGTDSALLQFDPWRPLFMHSVLGTRTWLLPWSRTMRLHLNAQEYSRGKSPKGLLPYVLAKWWSYHATGHHLYLLYTLSHWAFREALVLKPFTQDGRLRLDLCGSLVQVMYEWQVVDHKLTQLTTSTWVMLHQRIAVLELPLW
jgi:hypothetical protein